MSLRLIHENCLLETNCQILTMESSNETHFPISLRIANTSLHRTSKQATYIRLIHPPKKTSILYGRFKVICKNDDDFEYLLSTVKR